MATLFYKHDPSFLLYFQDGSVCPSPSPTADSGKVSWVGQKESTYGICVQQAVLTGPFFHCTFH